MSLNCEYIGLCGGCAWADQAVSDQHARKIEVVREVFPDARFVHAPVVGVRDRVDLVWDNGKLGLYSLNEPRTIVDLKRCPMMTAALEEFFKKFRSKAPPIKKGSVRLRVSPQGERGAWLDFANNDVKTLFEEKEYLKWLSDLAFVEIGQRRKALTWVDGQPKLKDPQLKPWFETYDAEMRAIPLYGPVGGFSQAGFKSNRALVAEVARVVKQSNVNSWVELFCGNGNFTLALAARGLDVEAVEMDPLAVEGLQRSLTENSATIRLTCGDVYLKSKQLPSLDDRGLLVDPPRAGMREVLRMIEEGARPSAIVYVSCFAEVFAREAAQLKSLGYTAKSLTGVDQFPHSPHTEWVGLFTRE